MREFESLHLARIAARAYEKALPSQQRKRLGQYFSGIPLGKLLAHLAIDSQTCTVLDPMAGHGDLLDATWEAASERGITLDRLDGIEIDEPTATTCRNRLGQISEGAHPAQAFIAADAFDPASIEKLPLRSYDLVITNPPYVRYQSRNANGTAAARVRSGLISLINTRFSNLEMRVWNELAEGYSGLADLSVPAWILAAVMVRSGGRLALVVPATWRSRDYADVIRYLLLRCFSLECIVEDKQPGWFSDALVRTNLVVARRLSEEDTSRSLTTKSRLPQPTWLQVAPEAASPGSLVGAAFTGQNPEAEFAAWLRDGSKQHKVGITARSFNLHEEWNALHARVAHRRWYNRLENHAGVLPIFINMGTPSRISLPESIRCVLPEAFSSTRIVRLEDAGILVGQGLRTGCNSFFYVTARGDSGDTIDVEASSLFEHHKFPVPTETLRPVLRRQSEMISIEEDRLPDGRVLDLRAWVLPEDYRAAQEAKAAYAASGQSLPQRMPDELAAYVRRAAESESDQKPIPELSAVRTNARIPRNGHVPPRFWYMLPDFAPRHRPAAFVARINHDLPWVEANFDPPLLIDANFSTFWASQQNWTRFGIKALINSIWCRAFMETLGTSLGGGALKLEATHLRQLAVPVFSDAAKAQLDAAGRELTRTTLAVQARVDAIVFHSLLGEALSPLFLNQLSKALADRAYEMSRLRRRTAS